MSLRSRSSRRKFQQYRQDELRRRSGGDGKNAAADRSTAPKQTHRPATQLLTQFFGLLRGHRLRIALALATLSISALLRLLPPAATKITIDYVLGEKPWPARLAPYFPGGRMQSLVELAVGVMIVSLGGSLISLYGRWQATLATKRVQIAVRRRAFEHAMRLPLHRVYQLRSGGVASLLRDDAGGVAELIFSMLYNPWNAVVQLAGSLAVLAWVDWRLLLGSLVLLPVVYFTHRTWIGRIRPLYRDVRSQRQEVDSHATEVFGGMRVVRAFGRGPSESHRFTRGNHLMARQELFAWGWTRTIELVWDVLIPLASAALLMYGGWQVLGGSLSLGDLMMFMVYLTMLLGPLEVLVSSAAQLQNNLAGLDRVLDLLAEPREMTSNVELPKLRPQAVVGHLVVDHVSFHYPGTRRRSGLALTDAPPASGQALTYPEAHEMVLRDVSLEARPGEVIALIGASGAGKTTLCNLIARFYDPTSGSIRLDGVDLRDCDLESYRDLLGIVEQDIFLFDGTIAENIAYARRLATPAEIRRAAEIANAHEFISHFEQGYDTVIGERGVRLSGGQRQRLAIARAVLADPRILIFDEATSNLDTESERLIQASLHELMQGRTSFVIAHRLSTIAGADRILVMDGGRIVESGTHDELLAGGGRYPHMVRLQFGGVD